MRKRVIAFGLVLLSLIIYLSLDYQGKTDNQVRDKKSDKKTSLRAGKVALINVYGEIEDTTPVMRLLNIYRNMSSVKAIVIRINSGGGAIASSQEVYSLIRKVSSEGKPVIVSMGNVAASGGYYIAAAADRIVANPGTLTGSIGVIMSFMSAPELMKKIGIDWVTVTSGKYKDIGSFTRNATAEEKALLKGMIEDVYNQFLDDIIDVRLEAISRSIGVNVKDEKIKKTKVKEFLIKNIADGRVFTGKYAQTVGLVDELGTIDDAIELAASMAGIGGRPMVVTEKKKIGFYEMLYSGLSRLNINVNFNYDKPLMAVK